MGVPPIPEWLIRENPILKWMIWGYPRDLGNLHIAKDQSSKLLVQGWSRNGVPQHWIFAITMFPTRNGPCCGIPSVVISAMEVMVPFRSMIYPLREGKAASLFGRTSMSLLGMWPVYPGMANILADLCTEAGRLHIKNDGEKTMAIPSSIRNIAILWSQRCIILYKCPIQAWFLAGVCSILGARD
jgi:hypothetical protein